jgi:hypothetical protein
MNGCPRCGSEMRRLMRESFLQKRFFPLFGYFPWECPICRKSILLRKRHQRKKRSKRAGASARQAGFAKPSNQNSSGSPSAPSS